MDKRQFAIIFLFGYLFFAGLALFAIDMHQRAKEAEQVAQEESAPDLSNQAQEEVKRNLNVDIEFSVPEQETKDNFIKVQGHGKTEDDEDVTYTAAFVKQVKETEPEEEGGLVEEIVEWVPVHLDVNGKIYVHSLPTGI